MSSTRYVFGQSLVTGLAAAFCALRLLRVDRSRPLWYLVASALPGLVLLGKERPIRSDGPRSPSWFTGGTRAHVAEPAGRGETVAVLAASNPACEDLCLWHCWLC